MVAPAGKMPAGIQRRLREATRELTGIVLGPEKEALLASRVQRRMRALGMRSYEQYMAHFDADRTELQQFINAITTNTTAFWREPAHFEIARGALDRWVEEGQRRFRIWCAASSTGQEPWTMALTFAPLAVDRFLDLRILATDIDTRVLGVARRAIYDAEALAPVPPPIRAAGFRRVAEGYQVVEPVRRLVRFGRLNLDRPPFPMRGPLDLIFCRNVMIYLDQNSRSRLLAECERLLKPGGLLLLGHSETAGGLARQLEMVQPSVYRMRGH